MARRMPRTLCLLFSAVCVVAGIYFSGGGIWLLTKGGSPYYLVAGIAFVAVGVLLVLRNPWALWMYTAIILGTMVWALWEVGIDWWQLAPRGDVVVILGVFLSWPWVAVGAKSANGRD